DALQKRIEKGKTTSECKKSGEDVPIDDIFGKSGVKMPKSQNVENIKPGSKWAEEIERFAFKKSNRAVKIFLASSYELQSEREKIELEINRMNKDLRHHGIFLELLIWEDGKHIGKSFRSQDNYNLELDTCDVFFLLFYSKVGKFTKEEFERAKARFDASNTPRMVLFQKNTDLPNNLSPADFTSRQAFLDHLRDIEHYPTEFGNTDALIRIIGGCIDNLIADDDFMCQLNEG
ncbi:MAG: hypothetical protein Q8K92_23960, partial [Leadbetterella sp.]|nr:hypothetical protein [Leadbetterella sp.]